MNHFDFLSAVQPDEGWFAVVGFKGGRRLQKIVATRADFDAWVARFVEQQRDVYFGVAKYTGEPGEDGIRHRRKIDVLALKAFWLDLDCGPDKPYARKAEAISALRAFCAHTGMPKPLVVDSGHGVHAYWPLVEPIQRAEWEPVAQRLKKVCAAAGLKIDPSCVEAARILRLPGTLNYKRDTPAPVRVLQVAPPTPFGDICAILGVSPKVAPPANWSGRPLSPLAQQVQANIEYSFAQIMRRGAKGCKQLLLAYRDRESLPEPRWFSALSVAKFCRDSRTAIHRLSQGHPDYDPEGTQRKIAHIQGPHTCAVFESIYPEGCAGCPHYGKIKSPITLGKGLAEANAEAGEAGEATEDENAHEQTAVPKPPEMPDPPFPYRRGKTGGIFRLMDGDEGEPLLVYPYDIYVVKRMRDPVEGGVVLIRSHTPQDGVEDFTIPNTKITDGKEVRKELARHDILLEPKRFELLVDYIIKSAQELRQRKRAETMRNQFGWAEGDSKFIIGDRELSVNGTYHSPPSSVTKTMAAYMEPVGSFEKWREVFNLYGRPGLEPAAFAAATAFGAPLFRFSGYRGAILNLVNTQSGTGKTTALHMCNSVWGHPERLCARKDDTFNSKVFKLGVLNNLPVTFDEMSNTDPKQLSDLAYMISQGTGKDRMKSSTNELRLNLTSWQTIALCSSNHSFYEKLEFLKHSPQGESMRIIEYPLEYSDAINIELGKYMFDHQLMENYGHAGDRYARYILENYEEVKNLFLTMQKKLDTQLKLTRRERFWSAVVAANLAGIYIASNRLRLFEWDLKAIFRWACQMILNLRAVTVPPANFNDDEEILGHFLLENMDSILVINGLADRRSKMVHLPLLKPKREIKVRYEPDTNRVFISTSAFRTYCTLRNIGYRETLRKLEMRGVLLVKRERKRMSKGLEIDIPAIPALVFDANHPDFASLVEIAENDSEQSNASSGD